MKMTKIDQVRPQPTFSHKWKKINQNWPFAHTEKNLSKASKLSDEEVQAFLKDLEENVSHVEDRVLSTLKTNHPLHISNNTPRNNSTVENTSNESVESLSNAQTSCCWYIHMWFSNSAVLTLRDFQMQVPTPRDFQMVRHLLHVIFKQCRAYSTWFTNSAGTYSTWFSNSAGAYSTWQQYTNTRSEKSHSTLYQFLRCNKIPF